MTAIEHTEEGVRALRQIRRRRVHLEYRTQPEAPKQLAEEKPVLRWGLGDDPISDETFRALVRAGLVEWVEPARLARQGMTCVGDTILPIGPTGTLWTPVRLTLTGSLTVPAEATSRHSGALRPAHRAEATLTSSQAIALNLRWYLDNSRPGATYATYPRGSQGPSVLVEYTREERADNWRAADKWLTRWWETDREGYDAFMAACAAASEGETVDPCTYCGPCRSRRHTP